MTCKLVDNFDLIADFMVFDNPGDFYVISIMQRRKDIPDLKYTSMDICTFYVKSKEHLYKLSDTVKKICDALSARAYISIYPVSPNRAALNTISKITENIMSGNPMASCRSWESSCANSPCNLFLVDIDTKDPSLICALKSEIEDIRSNSIITELPTPNGVHLITQKFNRSLFPTQLLDLDFFEIKTRALTILYFKQND